MLRIPTQAAAKVSSAAHRLLVWLAALGFFSACASAVAAPVDVPPETVMCAQGNTGEVFDRNSADRRYCAKTGCTATGDYRAPRFIATNDSTGTVADAGANFQCPNNPATSSPCLANHNDSLELGGTYHGTPQGDSASVYIGAMVERDGGSLLDILQCFGAGGGCSERRLFRFWYNGVFDVAGQNLNLNTLASSNGGRINSSNGGIYFQSTDGEILTWNMGSGHVEEWYAGGGPTLRAQLRTDGVYRQPGLATGSLPTCNAGMASGETYDTTRAERVSCNGSSWSPYKTGRTTELLGVIDSDELAWGSPDTSATLIAGTPGFTITRLSTRMSAGVGAGTINMSCVDVATPANICNCAVSCTASGDQTWTCASGGGTGCTFSGDSLLVFCAKTSNCPTTNPSSKDIMIWGTRP